jgi:hypothetical protein
MTTTLERDRRGVLVAVVDGEHRRRVVRDKAGRIASGDGDSRLNDLAEILTRLVRAEPSDAADAADDLSAIATEMAGRTRNLEAVAERCERVVAERMTDVEAVAERCEQGQRDAATELEAVAARHAQDFATRAKTFEQTALRHQGWAPVGGDLLINKPNLADAVQRLAITWPIEIDWMTPDDAADSDERYGSIAHGYRRASTQPSHTVVLRPGLGAEETGRTCVHELAHCRQVEWWRGLFDLIYLAPGGRDALERQADEYAARVTAELELFRASPQHEPDTF